LVGITKGAAITAERLFEITDISGALWGKNFCPVTKDQFLNFFDILLNGDEARLYTLQASEEYIEPIKYDAKLVEILEEQLEQSSLWLQKGKPKNASDVALVEQRVTSLQQQISTHKAEQLRAEGKHEKINIYIPNEEEQDRMIQLGKAVSQARSVARTEILEMNQEAQREAVSKGPLSGIQRDYGTLTKLWNQAQQLMFRALGYSSTSKPFNTINRDDVYAGLHRTKYDIPINSEILDWIENRDGAAEVEEEHKTVFENISRFSNYCRTHNAMKLVREVVRTMLKHDIMLDSGEAIPPSPDRDLYIDADYLNMEIHRALMAGEGIISK